MEPEARGEPGMVSSRLVHDGRIVHLSVDTVSFPDGSVGELEMIRHRGASAILPVAGSLEEDDPHVLLLRQYRYATGGYMYEVPAGVRGSPDEGWDECAHRELEEETGFRAGRLIPLTRIYTTPGFTDEVIHLFMAVDLEPGEANLDHDEFLEVVRLRFSEVVRMVRDGEIVDGKSVCTVLLAALHLGRP